MTTVFTVKFTLIKTDVPQVTHAYAEMLQSSRAEEDERSERVWASILLDQQKAFENHDAYHRASASTERVRESIKEEQRQAGMLHSSRADRAVQRASFLAAIEEVERRERVWASIRLDEQKAWENTAANRQ